VPLAIDQTHIPQQAQMMRDGRLFDRKRYLQVTDTDLTSAACQHGQDLNTDGMCEDQQVIRELLRGFDAELLIGRTAAAGT
jgi:hypothetical protein